MATTFMSLTFDPAAQQKKKKKVLHCLLVEHSGSFQVELARVFSGDGLTVAVCGELCAQLCAELTLSGLELQPAAGFCVCILPM